MFPDSNLDPSSLERPSIASTNMYGDIGSPCLMPLVILKKPQDAPFIDTEKEAVDIH